MAKNVMIFKCAWFLPLGEVEYLLFWRKINYQLKKGQYLYNEYLDTFNFYSLFKEFKPRLWNWQRSSLVALILALFFAIVGPNSNELTKSFQPTSLKMVTASVMFAFSILFLHYVKDFVYFQF